MSLRAEWCVCHIQPPVLEQGWGEGEMGKRGHWWVCRDEQGKSPGLKRDQVLTE